ncbi:FIST C-terminal domain-containing protein [Candidatus Woesearchaeota archaeon]|nr:FIST C-terminal domain-containing protein [Candidatus Woesearchaeota archaeon]
MANLVRVGTGFSQEKDSKIAAELALTHALSTLGGKPPQLTLVFYSGDFDPYAISAVVKKQLGKLPFVGGSTDAVVYDDRLHTFGIAIACVSSDYLHFGVAGCDNISKNTLAKAKDTIRHAVQAIPLDHYTDAYMAFNRMKKGNITGMIRIPNFFSFVFTRGFQVVRMGNEDLIIDGMNEEVGYYIPLFGGSLGDHMEKVFNQTPYEIYAFHNGKVYRDGLVCAFACTDLLYAHSLEHGYNITNKLGAVTGVANGGFVVTDVNHQNVTDWYASQVGSSKQKFLKNILYHTQKNPVGIPDGFGHIIMRAGGVPFKNYLSYIAPFHENAPVFVMDMVSKPHIMKATKTINGDLHKQLKKHMDPCFTFVTTCSSRRLLLQDDLNKEVAMLKKHLHCPIFGFSSFGEIGSKPASPSHFHHLTINVFTLYDELLTNLR